MESDHVFKLASYALQVSEPLRFSCISLRVTRCAGMFSATFESALMHSAVQLVTRKCYSL